MRYINDDFNQYYTQDIAYMPDAIKSAVALKDPIVNAEIDNMIQNAVNSGIDLSKPEMMGNFIDDFMSKVQQAVNYVTGGEDVTITTESGITKIGPSGVAYTTAPATVHPGQTTTTFKDYLKNPYVIAGLVGVPVLLMLLSKKKRRRK